MEQKKLKQFNKRLRHPTTKVPVIWRDFFFGAESRTEEKDFQVLYNQFVLTLHYFKKTTTLTTIIASACRSLVLYCKTFL
jgi:hypothetical protein